MYVKKRFIGIFLAVTCLVLTGCFADMKVVEEDATAKLHESKLSPYIKEASYKAGGKNGETTPVNINLNVDEEFSNLETMVKYEIIQDAITKLDGLSIECGSDNRCIYDTLHISYGDNKYKMSVNDKELVINDDEKYTRSDYKYDMDKINKIDPTEKYKGSSNSVPSSSSGQVPPPTYDPKKDSANYDANGNYKPVDQMKPEEIKKELEGMLEESLNR